MYSRQLLRHHKERSALVVAILLVFSVLFSGCSRYDIIRPSRKEIIEAGLSLWDGPVELNIAIDMVLPDDVVMYYTSTVVATEDTAQWSGQATVYHIATYFRQKCVTMCDETGSAKEWHGKWAVSDNTSPVPALRGWLQKAKTEGAFRTVPVVPAELSGTLKGLKNDCYRITLNEEIWDYRALCDVHLDSLFGGNERLQAFQAVKVDLLFDTHNLSLTAILLSAEDRGGGRLEISVRATASTSPNVDLSSMSLSNAILSEEWEIIGHGDVNNHP